MIVVDASLVTKWFLNETDSDRSRRFLENNQGDLCGPDVLTIEVARALVAAANSRRAEKELIRATVDLWLDTVMIEALTLYPPDTWLVRRGADIALTLGHPLMDCIYLALALELDCGLVTCDAKFQAKAAPIYSRVKLLADFS